MEKATPRDVDNSTNNTNNVNCPSKDNYSLVTGSNTTKKKSNTIRSISSIQFNINREKNANNLKTKINQGICNSNYSKSNKVFIKYVAGMHHFNNKNKNSSIFSFYEGNSSSNPNMKFDIKKPLKSICATNTNTRKNSSEKEGNKYLHNNLIITAPKKNTLKTVATNFIKKNELNTKPTNDIQNSKNALKSTQKKNKTGFITYITSNIKHKSTNNSKPKISNKDYLQRRFMKMKNKSITTVQSKNNSKSFSRFEDYSNVNSSNVKQNDYSKKGTIIKHNVPLTACQSPCGKSTQNIFKKNPFGKSSENKVSNIFKGNGPNLKKIDLELIALSNINSKKLHPLENISNRKVSHLEGENITELDKMLFETVESMQSTARESMYFRREMEKVAAYIKKYYKENGTYPETKEKFYKYGRLIGKGGFGKVNLALHICSGRLVAIKSFNKKNLKSKHAKGKIKHEIDIMKKLKHPFITRILDTFETETHVLIVMEYICGDLLGFIRKRSKLTEPYAKLIFKQIIEGLKYIHSKGIVHRDIKLDNILIDLTNTVKICDFGVSKRLSPGDIMKEHCGTPAYIAPEIFQDKGYEGFSCDIWSAGVTLYYMLGGVQPFKGNNPTELKKMVKSGKFQKLEKVSPEANDLIQGMLTVDPRKRITINQILSHPWLANINVNNRQNMTLFTKAELILLAKYDVDYLNSPKEDLIEHFSIKNLDTLIEEERQYGNTKSLILAPFNSEVKPNSEESFLSKDIKIENNLMKFRGKAKQSNLKYELNNNSNFDNGILKTQSDESEDEGNQSLSDNSVSQAISPNVERVEKIENNENESHINQNASNSINSKEMNSPKSSSISSMSSMTVRSKVINEIETTIGYSKKYLMSCIKKNEVNYATATYYLLCKDLEEL